MIVCGNHVPSIPSSDLFDDILRRSYLTDDAYCPIDAEAEHEKESILNDKYSTVYMQVDWKYNRGKRIGKLSTEKLISNLSGMTDGDGDIHGDMCFFSRNTKLTDALLNCFIGAIKIYKYTDKDGYKRDVKEYRLQKNMVLEGDDGEEIIQPGEALNVDNDVVVDYEKIALAQKISYYLRMFHEGSKRKGLSLLSFIIAYIRVNHGVADDERKDNRKYVAQQIYRVDANGNCTTPYNENHNTSKAWAEQAAWFYNRNDREYQDIYNVHVDEFMELCLRAGINLGKEDPTVFTDEVIRGITTTYIASNLEFVDSYLGRIDSAVFKCLSPDGLLKPGSAILTLNGESNGCYFMDSFIDELTEVLNTNYSSDKSFINKQAFYTREFDEDALYISGVPAALIWYYMADVYSRMLTLLVDEARKNKLTHADILKRMGDTRVQSFRITLGRIMKKSEAKSVEGMVQSSFYVSKNEEYFAWRQIDRMSELALNDYIICTRDELHSVYSFTNEQLRSIPEKFVITSLGCVVGQRYSGTASLRAFDVYRLEGVTEFLNKLVMESSAANRQQYYWPDPEVF